MSGWSYPLVASTLSLYIIMMYMLLGFILILILVRLGYATATIKHYIYQGASQATQNILQSLVRRMTRFLVKLSLKQAQGQIEAILTELKLHFKQVITKQLYF